MAFRSVLLVDDDTNVRRIAELSLAKVGKLDVRTASSAAAALEALRDPSTLPDVVMLDVMMPGMDGPSLLERLRADPRTASLPVVFMTAKVDGAELARLRSFSVLGVLQKPFDPMTLAESLQRLGQGPPR